jgi:ribosomal protein S27AE
MIKEIINEVELSTTGTIRKKPTERECPRCEAVLVHNDNEQCYECNNCGFIDCGEDE